MENTILEPLTNYLTGFKNKTYYISRQALNATKPEIITDAIDRNIHFIVIDGIPPKIKITN